MLHLHSQTRKTRTRNRRLLPSHRDMQQLTSASSEVREGRHDCPSAVAAANVQRLSDLQPCLTLSSTRSRRPSQKTDSEVSRSYTYTSGVSVCTGNQVTTHVQALTFPRLAAVESHVFSTKSPSAFHKFYAPPDRGARESVDIAEDELRFTTLSVRSERP